MEGKRGNCVAISPKLALCALHEKVRTGVKVTVVIARGRELAAKIVLSRFEANKVDISVLELDSTHFDSFITIHRQPMKELDNICLFGMKLQNDQSENFSARGQVNTVRQKGAIIESSYPGCAGLSGAPVVTVIEHNELRVVGVHVGIHGDSAEESDEESFDSDHQSQPASRQEMSDALSTFSQASHALSTYAMICDVARVRGLVKFLDNKCRVDDDLDSSSPLTDKKRKRR